MFSTLCDPIKRFDYKLTAAILQFIQRSTGESDYNIIQTLCSSYKKNNYIKIGIHTVYSYFSGVPIPVYRCIQYTIIYKSNNVNASIYLLIYTYPYPNLCIGSRYSYLDRSIIGNVYNNNKKKRKIFSTLGQ